MIAYRISIAQGLNAIQAQLMPAGFHCTLMSVPEDAECWQTCLQNFAREVDLGQL